MDFLFLVFNTAVQTDYALEYNPERDVTISVEWLKRAKVVNRAYTLKSRPL